VGGGLLWVSAGQNTGRKPNKPSARRAYIGRSSFFIPFSIMKKDAHGAINRCSFQKAKKIPLLTNQP